MVFNLSEGIPDYLFSEITNAVPSAVQFCFLNLCRPHGLCREQAKNYWRNERPLFSDSVRCKLGVMWAWEDFLKSPGLCVLVINGYRVAVSCMTNCPNFSGMGGIPRMWEWEISRNFRAKTENVPIKSEGVGHPRCKHVRCKEVGMIITVMQKATFFPCPPFPYYTHLMSLPVPFGDTWGKSYDL